MAILADDNMVVNGDAQRAGRVDDGLRHVDIGARGSGVAGGMIMDHPTLYAYPIDFVYKYVWEFTLQCRLLGAMDGRDSESHLWITVGHHARWGSVALALDQSSCRSGL